MERKCPFDKPVCVPDCALRDGEKTCLDRVIEVLKALKAPEKLMAPARKG